MERQGKEKRRRWTGWKIRKIVHVRKKWKIIGRSEGFERGTRRKEK